MPRKQLLDLDVLDSPLFSPSPLTSIGGVPGSAIAEKIFNDPDSWDNPSGQDSETSEEMGWFADQVEQLQRLSAVIDERETISSMEQSDLILHAFQQTENDATKQEPSQTDSAKSKAGRKVEGFAKIWEARGLRPPPSPLSFSPPSSSEGADEFLHLHISPASTPSSKVASASATWSFLEWYGIQPGSPHRPLQSAVVESKQRRPRGLLQVPMTSHFLPDPPTSPPKVPLPPLPYYPSMLQDDTSRPSPLVRRLPAVPATSELPKASATLSRTSSPAPEGRKAPAAPQTAPRSFSDQWPSALPSASSVRTPSSVRSPPPAGPRPKGFAQRARPSSRSPPRTLAPRPPALNL